MDVRCFCGSRRASVYGYQKAAHTANRCLFQNLQLQLGADITVNFEIEQYSKSDPFFNILDDIWVEISYDIIENVEIYCGDVMMSPR